MPKNDTPKRTAKQPAHNNNEAPEVTAAATQQPSPSRANKWAVAEEFLTTFFGADKIEQVWLTGFSDIENHSWFGVQGLSRLKNKISDPDNADLYFCTGLVRNGARNRTIGEIVAQPVLYADDIGTKVDRKLWTEMLDQGFPPPTAKIATSPGNESWIWHLEGDPTTPERWRDLALIRAYMIERGLTDGIHDATRYMRLPCGHNSKLNYKDNDNQSPTVGYVEWNPDNTGSLDVIGPLLTDRSDWRDADMPVCARTGAQLAASVGAGALVRNATLEDTFVRMADIVGLEPRLGKKGVVDALCPNWEAHGDRPETGFAFITSGGLCKCNHASCVDLRSPDMRAIIRTKYEEHVSGLEAMDLNSENLPLSASGFEARAEFERLGASSDPTDKGYAAAVTDADAIASRNAKAQALRTDDLDAAIARLIERFVWVKGAEAFHDQDERAFYSPAGLARHEAVTKVIPAGTTGQKAAANVLANHPDRIVAAGLAYVPGTKRTLVNIETESGITAPHINTWVPSRYGPVAGSPDLWLRVVEHVLHDVEFRNWFLDWLAWIIQNPAERTPIIPLLISGQGAGKDTVLRPIQQLLGAHNCTSVTTGQITGAFTEFLRKRLLLLQEAKFDAGGAAYNRVKDWTGNSTGWVDVNEKYQRPYRHRFAGVFIALSNDEGAVKGIDHDDRRFAPFISEAGRLDAVFSPADHATLDSADEIGRVLQFLETRDLSAFNPHATPNDVSGSRTRIIAAGMTAAARAAYELVTNGPFADREIIAFDEVTVAVQGGASRLAANSATWSNVQTGLAAAGCLHIRPRGADQVKVNGRNARLWTGPKAPAWVRDVRAHKTAAPKKFADAYQAELDRVVQASTVTLIGGT